MIFEGAAARVAVLRLLNAFLGKKVLKSFENFGKVLSSKLFANDFKNSIQLLEENLKFGRKTINSVHV